MPAPFLWLEFLVLFGLLPSLHARGWLPFPKIPLLLVFAGGCLIYLGKGGFLPKMEFSTFLRKNNHFLRAIALRSLMVALCSAITVFIWAPDQLFGFPRARPLLWLAVMALYPLLSAFPQETIYRAFLFHRYAPILRTERARTWASVLAFSFLHIVFANWVAVALTLPAGWIFTRTYRRTGSLLLASLEHAAYGCIVFTVGLGRFFYNPA
ncbi:CAAX amino terminal protease self- immunity [Pseudodesulfovibrio hydrargyri]|uniref:CAAX amino terminal protease self-immunity n=1 Tax=Pseudodesulfovibrio hydrargyri TaxID=2125990 RepID=A0A1J5N630_9BACT|nr:CPBP family intramembrane glutamic endopeptidase [Pseudodesulfovibrio hydrargyri]OIQ48783.1 CAAX amino terminal protease self- immunity [Pseudodesulfovibrio hydrargyri]